MLAAVNRISSDKNYDVVISSTTFTAPYALRLSKIPRILEEHNFQTSWMKERYHSQNSFLKKSAGWITWQKCLRYERWLYSQFQACIMVSEHDKTAVEATFPFYAGRVSIIPNGVDLIQNHPGISSPVPGTLVFNGGLGYYANLDAMRFFLADIFPRILSHHPGVKIQITGRTDSLDLSQLQLNKNVFFTGFLDDIRPTVASSWACVVPLRIGSGTRLKILEAMALGTPVISTSKGAEGLDICPGENILIADHPEEFANQVLRLLCDPDLREKLARNARVLVEEKYGWEGISESFCRLVEKIAGQGYQTPKKGNHAS
jgi:glycosyltransferase involved in cell wall biosynthesis